MKDIICDEFQSVVGEVLIRHHSILDILAKISEGSGQINRAVTKSVTDCGCVSIDAEKVNIPKDIESVQQLREYLDSHLRGNMCPNCEDVLSNELGTLLFYCAALCNCVDISLYDVFLKEYKKISALGIYNMS